MINLLSYERKSEIRAARVNVILTRYIGMIAIAVVFLMAVLYVSYTVLQQTMATAETQISSNDIKADVYSATKAEVDALSSKLTDARTLLDQEVSYATLLTSLGQAMPAGTILESLKVDDATLSSGAPVEITAYAQTDEAAATIQQSLQALPIFTQVSLSGTDSSGGIEGYPTKVTLSIVFNRSAL